MSLLEAEGVRFIDGKVDLSEFRWKPSTSECEMIDKFVSSEEE